MPRIELPVKSFGRTSGALSHTKCSPSNVRSKRHYSASAAQHDAATVETHRAADEGLLLTAETSPSLKILEKSVGNPMISGSRRRRALLGGNTTGVPFEQLPYQCFQEARKILLQDREEKLQQIQIQRERIARLKEADASVSGGEIRKRNRILSMQRYLEELKIKADINDPMVKKRFEDGQGDMNKPIYRYLANRKWREYRRPILMQRITQMNVIPDVLPTVDPIMDITVFFRSRSVQPGDFVQSTTSETAPKLHAQLFEQGRKLVTIAVIDSDVPNVNQDSFGYRCHFLASNISITPTSPVIDLADLQTNISDAVTEPSKSETVASVKEESVKESTENPAAEVTNSQTILPWLPPFANKGSPYHRLSLFILHQKDNTPINIEAAQKRVVRDGFKLRSFQDTHMLHAIGVSMFRTHYDEGTDAVMERLSVPDIGLEFKRKKVEPLPYKRRNPSTFR